VLVVDVESLGPSAQGRIRQPSYVGTRADLTPEDLT
jgi:bifunctional non-homologous end joining protein LigD